MRNQRPGCPDRLKLTWQHKLAVILAGARHAARQSLPIAEKGGITIFQNMNVRACQRLTSLSEGNLISAAYIDPVFGMTYPQNPPVCDYRSVVNAAGTAVIFERWEDAQPGNKNPPFVLYQLDLTNGATPVPFLKANRSSRCLHARTGRGTRDRWRSAMVRASGSSVTMEATQRC
jgi:hypothetical protein